jgi:hypothetical protein
MVAADLVVVVHMGFLAYMVFGGFLALRRFALIWPHIGTILWSVYVILASYTCPLTRLEKWLLERGGTTPYDESFIGHYLSGTVYPEQYEIAVWLAMIGLALTSYALALTRRRRLAVA